MTSLKLRAGRLVRRIAENEPRLESLVRKLATRPRVRAGDGFVQKSGGRYTLVSSRTDPDAARVGIYLRGACDLPALFAVAPLLREEITGTCCILRDPIQISGSRSDCMVERLDEPDPAARTAMEDVRRRLNLPPTYFGTELFSKDFSVSQLGGITFPKSVVVLTTAPDFSRTLYRHREHGFLVDPGGFWLDSDVKSVLGDSSTVGWFRDNFRSVGRLPTDSFVESFGRLVSEIRVRTGAHLMVFNMLTVDPADATHSYRLMAQSDTVRRREFTVALAELSHRHDFDVIDADRILKLGGISEQVDFAHFSQAQFRPIAQEAYRILREREIV
jgi:hypothetical protein